MQKSPATLKAIAEQLRVSVSTVSRALNDHPRISEKTKSRVKELAEKLHYVPNPAALLLKKNKTYTIGVLLPFLKEEFFSLAISAIEDTLMPEDYHVLISQSRDSLEREKKMIESFIASRVDGLIASVSAETNHYGHFKALEEYGIPVVFFDRVPRNIKCHKVRNSVTQGAKEAMRFLVNKGVTKIGLINGPGNLEVSGERLNGYLEAAMEFGIDARQHYIKSGNLTREETEQCMMELLALEDRPQAVLTFNDYVALYAMSACRKAGVEPNKDILFVSFANLPITSFLENPPIASVEQFASKMGAQAANLLLKCLQNQESELDYQEIIIKTELIIH
ncbi:LacI family DNA-binding transcriptional regulator [Jiulongibacter sediminis]|uniref:LacI family transcriptional regulator n=1 Tax=Jiulongibacter sediminis TaxID=1605367 RepID=A0A0P7C9H3_9BACT|nr:LacI family DNA-binding transcriptional regulator [Jiulongibacter sediminis]KPM49126.1 LacI family transcriptional regulator [Jiulongibacter sediminis]TBX26182.1 LacI family transcriptional regulator [Jiulongibacter sediminis]